MVIWNFYGIENSFCQTNNFPKENEFLGGNNSHGNLLSMSNKQPLIFTFEPN